MTKRNRSILIPALLSAGLLVACGEEATPTPGSATLTPGAPTVPVSLSPTAITVPTPTTVALPQITFKPIGGVVLPSAPAPVATDTVASAVTATVAPAQTQPPALPPLPSPGSVNGGTNGAARPTQPPGSQAAPAPTPTNPPLNAPASALNPNAPDSRAGGELVGKVLQRPGYDVRVKRVERYSRVPAGAGKNHTTAGVFLVVLYDMTNKTGQNAGYAEITLRDDAGREYKSGAKPELEQAQAVYKLFWDTPTIRPNQSAQQYRVFEVPKDAKGFSLV